MKNFLLSISLCLFTTLIHAQNDKYVYLDSLGRETKPGEHKSYKIIKDYKKQQKNYTVKEYYLSGNIKSEGIFSDNEGKKREGFFTEYYENGNAKCRTMYTDNIAYGDFVAWHENGNKKLEGEYVIDNYSKPVHSDLKINNTWDKNNNPEVVNGNGLYTESSDVEFSKGELKNGLKNNLWEGISRIGNLTFKETYSDGKLIEGTSTDSLNNTYSYKATDLQAGPKNGMQEFYKAFGSKINLPEVEQGITEIKIILSFVIEKDGKINDIKTIKSFDSRIDKIFIKQLSKVEDWRPATHRGVALRSQFTFPVTIQISETIVPYNRHRR